MYQYPYGNAQQLNLDWILNKLKELESGTGGGGTNLEEVSNALIALTYTEQNYNLSDIVFHEEKLYSANQNITAEPWNPAHWNEVLLANPVSNLVRYVSALNNSQVFNSSNVAGTHTSDALNNLNSDINDLNTTLTTLLSKNFEYQGAVASGTDLDTLYKNGWYELAYSGTYPNSPEVSGTIGQRHIYIYSEENPSLIKYKFMYYVNFRTGVVGLRIKSSMVWLPWKVMQGAINNTVNYTKIFTPTGTSHESHPTTKKIKICQYNVAHYNNDTSTYLPDDKILNFRRFLAEKKFDFVCTQEEVRYCDGVSKDAREYLFYPVLRDYYAYGAIGNNSYGNQIHSNILGDSSFPGYKFKFSNAYNAARNIQVGLFNIGGKKVLFIDAHCTWSDFGEPTSAAAIAGRLSNYQDIFNWENGTSPLKRADNNADVTCPTHDIAIICMDANCITDTDKSNLLDLCNTNNWKAGNGGRFGWFDTCKDVNDSTGMASLDFCAVKGSAIIENCKPLYDWYPLLYSDHVPVEFDIAILDPEPETISPSFEANVSSNSNYQVCQTENGITALKLYLTAASAISGGADVLLATGIPKPRRTYQVACSTITGESFRVRLQTNGELHKWYGDAIPQGTDFIIDTMYFST